MTQPDDLHPVYTKVAFADLPGWTNDNHAAIREPLSKSCAALEKQSSTKQFGRPDLKTSVGELQKICAQLLQTPDGNIKSFIETHFDVYSITDGDNPANAGLFTGYYEASLNGSRKRHGKYQTPIYKKPADLVVLDEGTPQKRTGKWLNGEFCAYDSRYDIDCGALQNRADVIAYVDDPVDAFFLHIQGSGVITMDDGSAIQVGYHAQNGHAYTAIGAELIKREALERDNVSMQTIREWLKNNPTARDEILQTNPSYIFFRELNEGPVGSQGVVITPERTLAVDRRAVPLGALLWLDAEYPGTSDQRIQRLMMAQDTGGAIKGAIRGDVFWGAGPIAEHNAGLMKSKGRYWILVPKNP